MTRHAIKGIRQLLRRKPKALVIVISCLLVLVIGIIDSLTGPELPLSALYLLPISVATYFAGIQAGMFISLASVICYLLADKILAISYSHSITPYLNSGVRLIFFVVMTYALGKRRQAEQKLQQSEERFRLLIEGVQDSALLMLDKNGFITDWNAGAARLLGYEAHEVKGRNFSIFYADAAGSTSEHDLQLAVGDKQMNHEGWRIRKDGSKFFADSILTPLCDESGHARGFSLLLRDVTERRKSAEAQRVLAELHDIDRAILAADTSEAVAKEALDRLRPLLPYRNARVIMIDLERDSFKSLAVDSDSIETSSTFSGLDSVESSGIQVLKTGKCHFPEEYKGAVFIPLLSQDQLIGVLALHTHEPLSELQLEIGREVADQLAIAIHNTQLLEQLQQAHHRLQLLSHKLIQVQENERRHLARELHDEMGQALTVVKIHMQELESRFTNHSAEPLLRETILIVEKLLNQVRSLSLDLRPLVLDDLGLIPALRWYVSRQSQLGGFSANFTENIGDLHLSPEVETTCFRVTQEALTNVARHANARRVSVELETGRDHLKLLIKDDGVGFDVSSKQAEPSTGLGLLGMKERVLLIGGAIDVESAPQCGTEIRVHLPLHLEQVAQ